MSYDCSKEIKHIQSQEKKFNRIFVICLLSSSIVPALFMKFLGGSLIPLLLGLAFVLVAFFAHYKRMQFSRQFYKKFEELTIGMQLAKRLPSTKKNQFVIVDKSTQHFNLRCLKTGQIFLVSKSRVQEDFEIAN